MKAELEIRGKFSDRSSLERFLEKIKDSFGSGEHRSRLSVIFSSKNDEGKDLQVRLHNLTTQVVLKTGSHSDVQRSESLLTLPLENFLPAVDFFYRLGFAKGVVADCEDWIFILDKTELKITTCDSKIYCWELESLSNKVGKVELEKIARSLGLVPFTHEELKEYWVWMQTCVNKPFSQETIPNLYKDYLSRKNIPG